MRLVTPSGDVDLSGNELRQARGRGKLLLDVGTGDGRFAYHLAKQRPDDLVVGLDPVAENLRPMAVRAARKPSRGGVVNLLLVRGSVEDGPESPLAGLADEVFVVLPWGRLLAGVLQDDRAVKRGLVAFGHPGTRYTIVLNCEIWVERTPAEYADLPVATPAYVDEAVAPPFAELGLVLDDVRYLGREETAALQSSWARRLSHGRPHPRFLLLAGSLTDPPAPGPTDADPASR